MKYNIKIINNAKLDIMRKENMKDKYDTKINPREVNIWGGKNIYTRKNKSKKNTRQI